MKLHFRLSRCIPLLLAAYTLTFWACNPEPTGQKFFLFVSAKDQAVLNDIVALASASARSQGTKLVFSSLDKFLDTSVNDLMQTMKDRDSLALVLYQEQWSPKLESRIKTLRALLIKKNIDLGLWFLGRGAAPPLPEVTSDWLSQGFDAVSSASAERPAKKVGKRFMEQLTEYRPASE